MATPLCPYCEGKEFEKNTITVKANILDILVDVINCKKCGKIIYVVEPTKHVKENEQIK